MDRRDFLKLAACVALLPPLPANGSSKIAFTFDDPSTNSSANLTWQQLNQCLLTALAQHQLSAALFVCGKRVDSPAGRELVASWNDASHLVGNHSYSHLYFPNTPLSDFEADAVKNEPLIRDYSHFARLYRYPFFEEGDTAAKRDGMRAFLASHGYRIGRATIDASDWAIDARLAKRAAASPAADLTPYRDFYLQHIWERATYYDSLAWRLSLSPVRHTLLLHHNALNALFFSDLVVMFQ